MFQLEGIDHVALTVSDVNRSAAWYIEVLGLEHRLQGMWGGVPVFVGRGATALALFPATKREDQVSEKHTRGRILHVAFRANRSDFLAAQAELRRRTIAFDFQDHEVSHSIYFCDPDENELEITTYELE